MRLRLASATSSPSAGMATLPTSLPEPASMTTTIGAFRQPMNRRWLASSKAKAKLLAAEVILWRATISFLLVSITQISEVAGEFKYKRGWLGDI